MGRKQALGKGLSALIPDYPEPGSDGEGARPVVELHIDEIEPNPHQPRSDFDEEQLDELMRSIQEKGLIQPIAVNRVGQSYQIITGERRWRATRKAGIEKIPAFVYEIESPQELMELTLIENIQREDLNPVEEAEGYRNLIHHCRLTPGEVAQKVGKDRSTVANLVRLLELPLEIQDYVRQDKMSSSHARTLLGLEEDDERLELARRCIQERMSVRAMEKAVSGRRSGRERKKRPAGRERRDPVLSSYEEKLQHRYGTAVHIHRTAKKGHVQIEFYDDGDLERILELLLEENE